MNFPVPTFYKDMMAAKNRERFLYREVIKELGVHTASEMLSAIFTLHLFLKNKYPLWMSFC